MENSLDHPLLTIFCPFSRDWAVELWLENLKRVKHNPNLTNLCFVIDGNMPAVEAQLLAFAKQNGYRSCYTRINTDIYISETAQIHRRQRIAIVHNQAKHLVARTDGVYVIGLEDDTVFHRLRSFEKLYGKLNGQIGFVEGVQMGRHGVNMIGAWKTDDVKDPKYIRTILPTPETISNQYEEIDAGGFYGYATHRHLFLDHDYFMSSNQPFGPDVNFGIYARQRGYKCLIDWGLVFGHYDRFSIGYPDDKKFRLCSVEFTKNINGLWDRKDIERKDTITWPN